MPTSFEASRFSVKNIFLQHCLGEQELMATIQRFWGYDTGIVDYYRMHRRESYLGGVGSASELCMIPLAFHQVWNRVSDDVLSNTQILKECKMEKFIMPPR